MNNFFEMGPIRPPSEAQSLLIRVTRNCPWNKCEFCHTYKEEEFSFRSVEEIKKDIDQVKEISDEIRQLSRGMGLAGGVSQGVLQALQGQPGGHSQSVQSVAAWLCFGGSQVFLQDANSLITKTSELAEILKYLKEKFPSIQRITSYARARTLAKKSVEELKELRQAGLSRIHIGMETGYDPLLQYMKKGVTAKEQIQGGRNVVESGISLSEYIMPGLGGNRWWKEHAVESAKVLNQINPDFIRLRTLYVRNDMPLFSRVEKGEFLRPSDDRIVSEIRLFIATLHGIQSSVISDHILNLLEEVQGKLPDEQEKMIAVIDRYLGFSEKKRLQFRVGRRLGYYRTLSDLQDPDVLSRVNQIIDNVGHPDGQEKPLSPEEVERVIHGLMESYI